MLSWKEIEAAPFFGELTPEEKAQSVNAWRNDAIASLGDEVDPVDKLQLAAKADAKSKFFLTGERDENPLKSYLDSQQKAYDSLQADYGKFQSGELADDPDMATLDEVYKGRLPAANIRGNVFVNDQLIFDKEAYTNAIKSTNADETAKASALAQYQPRKEAASEALSERLSYTDPAFREYAAVQSAYGKSDADIIDGWKEQNKLPDGVLGALQGTGRQAYLGFRAGISGLEKSLAGLGLFAGLPGSEQYAAESGKEVASYEAQRQLGGGPNLVGEVAQGAVSILPTLGAGAIGAAGVIGAIPTGGSSLALTGLAAGSIIGGLQSLGDTVAEAYPFYRQNMEPDAAMAKARIDGAISGAITGAVTGIIGKLGDKLGVGAGVEGLFRSSAGKVLNEANRNAIKQSFKSGLGSVFGSVAEEAVEESSDQLLQGLYERAARDPNKDFQTILEETLQAGKIGGIIGGGAQAGKIGVQKLFNSAKYLPVGKPEDLEKAYQSSVNIIEDELALRNAAKQLPTVAPIETASNLAGATAIQAENAGAPKTAAVLANMATVSGTVADAKVEQTIAQAEAAVAQAEDEGIMLDVFAAERQKAAARQDAAMRGQPLPAQPAKEEISPDEAAMVVYDLRSAETGDALDLDQIEMALDNVERQAAKGKEIDWAVDRTWLPNASTSAVPSVKRLVSTPEGRSALRDRIGQLRQQQSQEPVTPTETVIPPTTGVGEVAAATEPTPAQLPTEIPNVTTPEVDGYTSDSSFIIGAKDTEKQYISGQRWATNELLKDAPEVYSDAFYEKMDKILRGKQPKSAQYSSSRKVHRDSVFWDGASIAVKRWVSDSVANKIRQRVAQGRSFSEDDARSANRPSLLQDALNLGYELKGDLYVFQPKPSNVTLTQEALQEVPPMGQDVQIARELPVLPEQPPAQAQEAVGQSGPVADGGGVEDYPEIVLAQTSRPRFAKMREGEDIIDFLGSEKMQKPPHRKKDRGGEYDGIFGEGKISAYFQKKFFSDATAKKKGDGYKAANTPDTLAQAAFEAGFTKGPYVNDLLDAIEEAIQARKWRVKQAAIQNRFEESRVEQFKAFEEDKDLGEVKVRAGDLRRGDKIVVNGEEMTVTSVEYSGGDIASVKLMDGTTYGEQTVEADQMLGVDSVTKAVAEPQSDDPFSDNYVEPTASLDSLLVGTEGVRPRVRGETDKAQAANPLAELQQAKAEGEANAAQEKLQLDQPISPSEMAVPTESLPAETLTSGDVGTSAVAPTVEKTEQTFQQKASDKLDSDIAALPEKAQKAWTPEAKTAAANYFNTLDEASLDGLTDIQKRKVRFVAQDVNPDLKAEQDKLDEQIKKTRLKLSEPTSQDLALNQARATEVGIPTKAGVTPNAGAKIKEILGNIAKDKKANQLTRAIAKLLASLNYDGVSLRIADDENATQDSQRFAGYYDKGVLAVNLAHLGNGGVDAVGTFVHEALHAATASNIKAPKTAEATKAKGDLEALRSKIGEYLDATGNTKAKSGFKYELSNVDEFISALFTNKKFSDFLNTIPADFKAKKPGSAFRTLLDEIARIIARVLTGKPVSPVSNLEKAVRAALELMGDVEQVKQTVMPDGAILSGPALFSIPAYHGTPHKVDKFKLANIGTGEGAQAYGWGLYFAENRGVADGYRDALIGRQGNSTLMDGTPVPSWVVNRVQADGAASVRADFENRIKEAEARIAAQEGQYWLDEGNLAGLRQVLESIDKVERGMEANAGNLYTVELLPDEDEFLDWDKPLSEQSEKVKAALDRKFKNRGWDREHSGGGTANGGKPFREITRHIKGSELYQFYDDEMEPSDVSAMFSELGIPGIKYLDAGSRGAGDGTRNYVLFDENLVRILEENGKPVSQPSEARFSLPDAKYEQPLFSSPQDETKPNTNIPSEVTEAGGGNGTTPVQVKNNQRREESILQATRGIDWENSTEGEKNEAIRSFAKRLSLDFLSREGLAQFDVEVEFRDSNQSFTRGPMYVDGKAILPITIGSEYGKNLDEKTAESAFSGTFDTVQGLLTRGITGTPLGERFNPESSDIRFSLPQAAFQTEQEQMENAADLVELGYQSSMLRKAQVWSEKKGEFYNKETIAPLAIGALEYLGVELDEDGSPIVTPEVTERAMKAAFDMLRKPEAGSTPFAVSYNQQFLDDAGNVQDMATGVLRQEMVLYAQKMAAEGDTSLFKLMRQDWNGVITGAYLTVRASARQLAVLSNYVREGKAVNEGVNEFNRHQEQAVGVEMAKAGVDPDSLKDLNEGDQKAADEVLTEVLKGDEPPIGKRVNEAPTVDREKQLFDAGKASLDATLQATLDRIIARVEKLGQLRIWLEEVDAANNGAYLAKSLPSKNIYTREELVKMIAEEEAALKIDLATAEAQLFTTTPTPKTRAKVKKAVDAAAKTAAKTKVKTGGDKVSALQERFNSLLESLEDLEENEANKAAIANIEQLIETLEKDHSKKIDPTTRQKIREVVKKYLANTTNLKKDKFEEAIKGELDQFGIDNNLVTELVAKTWQTFEALPTKEAERIAARMAEDAKPKAPTQDSVLAIRAAVNEALRNKDKLTEEALKTRLIQKLLTQTVPQSTADDIAEKAWEESERRRIGREEKAKARESVQAQIQSLIDKLAKEQLPTVPQERVKKENAILDAFKKQVKVGASYASFEKIITDLGGTQDQARVLYGEALRKSEANKAAEKGTKYTALIKELKRFPVSMWSDPTVRDSLIRTFLKDNGITATPELVAGLNKDIEKHLVTAKERSLARWEKKVKADEKRKELPRKEKSDQQLQKIIDAIRAGFATQSTAAKAVAASPEFEIGGFRPEDEIILNQLDLSISKAMADGKIHLAALRIKELFSLLSRRRAPKSMLAMLAISYVNSALSSLGTMSINWISAFGELSTRFSVDIARSIATGDFRGIGFYFEAVKQALSTFYSEAKFAIGSDVQVSSLQQFILRITNMQREFNDGLRDVKDPKASAQRRLAGAIKVAAASTDLTRRVLSSADSVWQSIIQSYVSRSTLYRELYDAIPGMTREGAASIILNVGQASRLKVTAEKGVVLSFLGQVEAMRTMDDDAVAKAMDELSKKPAGEISSDFSWLREEIRGVIQRQILAKYTGQNLVKAVRKELNREMDSAEVRTQEYMLKEIASNIDGVAGLGKNGESLGTKMVAAANEIGALEGTISTGNYGTEQSPSADVMNLLVNAIRDAGNAVVTKHALLGRMMLGFFSVPAALLNKSLYFSPYGLYRHMLGRMYGVGTDANKANNYYDQTMRSHAQVQQRLAEAIAGTTVMALLMGLKAIDKDEPEDAEGFGITLNGPTNKTEKEAWLKQGHRKGALEWRSKDGTTFSMQYARGGLETLKIPFLLVGAYDDMILNRKVGDKAGDFAVSDYLGAALSGWSQTASFFGARNTLGSFSPEKLDASLLGNMSYTLGPLIPYSGLMASTEALFQNQTFRGRESAVWANIPVARSLLTTTAVNAFGDPLGAPTGDVHTTASDRLWNRGVLPLAIAKPLTGADERLYGFILDRGQAPALPQRAILEAKNRLLSDDEFVNFTKIRGRYLKSAIMSDLYRLKAMDDDALSKAMGQISSDATKQAKQTMGFK